jgi:multidrug efflux pump subunit AcrA (membrane-fusion protein)
MLKRRNYIKALLLCLVLLVAGCGGPDTTPAATAPASAFGSTNLTYVVQRGKVVKTLVFDGRVSPVEETLLYFKSLGYVKQVHVKQGEMVEAGDLLAELETDDLLNQIAQAEVALSSAQLLLSEAEKYQAQKVALAELDLKVAQTRLAQAEPANAYAITQAELALALAQEQLARAKSLQATYAAGVVRARVGLERAQEAVKRAEIEYQEALDRPWESQEVRDSYAMALQLTRWNLEVAQAQYDQAIAEEVGYQHELKIQEIAVEQASTGLEQLKSGVDPLLSLEVQRAQQALDWLKEGVDPALVNDVSRAQLALERLQSQLANAQIVAPVGGEVLSLSIYPGRPVEAFKTAIVIADPSDIQVSANLSDEQLKKMTEGQRATVVLNTDSDRTWSGAVLRMPYPYGSANNARSGAEIDNSTRISLEGDVGELQLGDLVHVSIVLEEKDNALWLPPAAIRTFQDRVFVIVQDGDRQRRVDVELGIEGWDQVEILKGLEQGQVVLAP